MLGFTVYLSPLMTAGFTLFKAISMSESSRFQYTVRVSARARRVNLCVRPATGLEVVVPKRFRTSRIPDILEANSAWIERALTQWQLSRAAMLADFPPKVLKLRGIGREIRVQYRRRKQTRRAGQPDVLLEDDSLLISGDIDDEAAIARALEAVVRGVAAELLPTRLSEEARRCRLQYAKVTVRGQRSRWGSCSSAGNISLNYKMLFLPERLLRYVLCHELAHLRHMNHSPAYWRCLESMMPGARGLDAELSRAGALVPAWLRGGIG